MNDQFIEEIKRQLPLSLLAGVSEGQYAECPYADCPSHDKSKKKAHVKPGRFTCYVCGRGGDIFKWYEAEHECSFKEAFYALADKVGLSLVPNRERSELLQHVVAAANRYLMTNPDKSDYLEKTRGLSKSLLFRYQIGYIDPEGEVLRASGVSMENLEHLGFISERRAGSENFLSFLAGRYIFPIRDLKGRLVQVKGRINPALRWEDGVAKSKPLMSRVATAPIEWGTVNNHNFLLLEEELHLARTAGFATLWEGEPDTYTAKMLGLPAYGLQGSQGLFKHAHKFRGVPRVYVGLDNDQATEMKLIPELLKLQLALPETVVYRIQIPHLAGNTPLGKPTKVDLNDYIVKFGKTKEDVENLIANAIPAYELLIDYLAPKHEEDSSFQDLRRVFRKAPTSMKQSLLSRISLLTGLQPEMLVFGLDPTFARTTYAPT